MQYTIYMEINSQSILIVWNFPPATRLHQRSELA